MKLVSKLVVVLSCALPGAALAHPGHVPLAGLPDLLLHYPWVLLPAVAIGIAAIRANRTRALTDGSATGCRSIRITGFNSFQTRESLYLTRVSSRPC